MFERADLDGRRIFQNGRPEVWLVFHGVRHHIYNPDVFDALFVNADNIIELPEAESLSDGRVLNPGTCLVQPMGGVGIYLVTGEGVFIRRHLIPTYESFCDFGFDLSKVVQIPNLVLEGIVGGREITSASDRAARLAPFRA